MTTLAKCTRIATVDAHFARRTTPGEQHELFGHLPTCDACRERYQRHLVLESADPEARGARVRLRGGLPLVSGDARARWIGAALALAACVLLAVGRHRAEDGFHARGPSTAAPRSSRVEIYRVAPGSTPSRVTDAIGHDDELAFTYANPSGKARVLVFATDQHGHVYWYYPAWTRAEDTPVAVPVTTSSELVELGEAIAQPIDAPRVVMHAIFTDEALTVRDIEKRVAASAPLAPNLGVAGAIETARTLEVR